MSMALLGAREETAKEMEKTLGVTSLRAATHNIYKDLIHGLKSVHDVVLNSGNAIFLNPRFEIREQYTNDVAMNYYSKAGKFDLSAPEKTINDYVAMETNNMIKDVLPEGSITIDTTMIVVNTLFFNGTWETPFPKDRTRQRAFHNTGGEVSKVDMMHSAMTIKYKKDDELNVQVAELPFKGKRFGFYIVLPETADDISSLESLLETPDNVDRLFSGLKSHLTIVSIPKFKTTTTLDLKRDLISLGMVKAFSSVRGVADFSGIRSKGDIYISAVIHKAKLKVTETGTVAAATTEQTQTLSKSVDSVSQPSLEFVADHPFLYFLRDNKSGQILFQGKFSN
ncbi:serpin B4-like [Physella acuta]|uniref:serpin B4-like n=1 Tax=Physella acuta TaxID=109671 RepID=UPI0027DE784E|nr:serpin B4-like [Physella acuta]